MAAGDPVATKNLLEIFAGLLEFILGKISEGGIDADDSNEAAISDVATREDNHDVARAAADDDEDDDVDIPSFLRATDSAPAISAERRRSVGSILPLPVAQSSLQSSKQSSDVESTHSQGTSTAAIVKVGF